VYINPVGLERIRALSQNLKVFPVPAKNELSISFDMPDPEKHFKKLLIYTNAGLLIREEEIEFRNRGILINIKELPDGVYTLKLWHEEGFNITKKLLISK